MKEGRATVLKHLEKILLFHTEKYPRMWYQDAVKLLYQSEFGGGHLISDEKSCLRYLLQEYAATQQSRQMPLTEDIGGGFVRVNLAALDAHGYSVAALGQDFIRSASLRHGSMESFQKKLQLLEDLTEQGKIPFSPESLSVYLGEYLAAGCPMVSHSAIYRECYRPAYRVVLASCLPDFSSRQNTGSYKKTGYR